MIGRKTMVSNKGRLRLDIGRNFFMGGGGQTLEWAAQGSGEVPSPGVI